MNLKEKIQEIENKLIHAEKLNSDEELLMFNQIKVLELTLKEVLDNYCGKQICKCCHEKADIINYVLY
jgi:hypothetical protein